MGYRMNPGFVAMIGEVGLEAASADDGLDSLVLVVADIKALAEGGDLWRKDGSRPTEHLREKAKQFLTETYFRTHVRN